MRLEVRRETLLFESDIQNDNARTGGYLAAAAEAYRLTRGQAAADEFIANADRRAGAVRIRRVSGADLTGVEREAFDAALASGQGSHCVDRAAGDEGEVITYV